MRTKLIFFLVGRDHIIINLCIIKVQSKRKGWYCIAFSQSRVCLDQPTFA